MVELKSLKYYIVNYRNQEIYHEPATNKILDDLVKILDPYFMKVKGDWNIRGGIKTIVETEYISDDYEMNPKKIDSDEKDIATVKKDL